MAEKQRILIVDDDANIAELISLYLMKECYETMIVGDGEEALKRFPDFKPNLVLLDLMLRHKADIANKIGEIEFTALSGHVCRYLDPDEYSKWKGQRWDEIDLPMIPDPFLITNISQPTQKKRVFNDIRDTLKNGNFDGIYLFLVDHTCIGVVFIGSNGRIVVDAEAS